MLRGPAMEGSGEHVGQWLSLLDPMLGHPACPGLGAALTRYAALLFGAHPGAAAGKRHHDHQAPGYLAVRRCAGKHSQSHVGLDCSAAWQILQLPGAFWMLFAIRLSARSAAGADCDA